MFFDTDQYDPISIFCWPRIKLFMWRVVYQKASFIHEHKIVNGYIWNLSHYTFIKFINDAFYWYSSMELMMLNCRDDSTLEKKSYTSICFYLNSHDWISSSTEHDVRFYQLWSVSRKAWAFKKQAPPRSESWAICQTDQVWHKTRICQKSVTQFFDYLSIKLTWIVITN